LQHRKAVTSVSRRRNVVPLFPQDECHRLKDSDIVVYYAYSHDHADYRETLLTALRPPKSQPVRPLGQL
jgi:hypothetical protein